MRVTQFPKRGMDTTEKGWSTRAEEVLLEEARVCLPLVGRLEQVRTVWKEREGGWPVPQLTGEPDFKLRGLHFPPCCHVLSLSFVGVL